MRYCQLLVVLFSFLFALTTFAAEKLSTEELLINLKAPDAKAREKAAIEIGERHEKLGAEALLEATKDKDPKVQMAAVEALGKIPDAQQVSYLSRAIQNTSGPAQHKGMEILTEVYIPSHEHGALKQLWITVSTLFDPPDAKVVEPWIRVDPEAVDALVFVLYQKESENRIDAAAALGMLRAKSAVPKIAYYLRSPDKKMARTCVRSLGYIGDASAGPDLLPLLKHSDDEIVKDTAYVLGLLRYREALPELQRLFEYSDNDGYRRAALQAISRMGDPSYEVLMLKYLDSDDKALKQYAIEGIGRMSLQQHVQRLQLQFQREKSRSIKMALAFSLYALGESAYIDTLIVNLKEPDYERQAQSYLVELGTRAVPGVAAYLKSADKSMRVMLLDLLGNMHQPSAIQYIEPYLKDQELEVAQSATHAVGKLRRIQESNG
jgi:HEAT repeat protein